MASTVGDSDSDIEFVVPPTKSPVKQVPTAPKLPKSTIKPTASAEPAQPATTSSAAAPKPSMRPKPRARVLNAAKLENGTAQASGYMSMFMNRREFTFTKKGETLGTDTNPTPNPAEKKETVVIDLDTSSSEAESIQSGYSGEETTGKKKKGARGRPRTKKGLPSKTRKQSHAQSTPSASTPPVNKGKRKSADSEDELEKEDSSDVDVLDAKATQRALEKAKKRQKQREETGESDEGASVRRSPRKADGSADRTSSPDAQERDDKILKSAATKKTPLENRAQPKTSTEDDLSQMGLHPDLLKMLRATSPSKDAANSTDSSLQPRDLGTEIALTITMTSYDEAAMLYDMAFRAGMQEWVTPIRCLSKSRQTFDTVYAKVAHNKQADPEAIVLEYNGQRVWPSSTPESLGILLSASLRGYRIEDYTRLQNERHNKNLAIPTLPPRPTTVERPRVEAQVEGDPNLAEQDAVAAGHIRLTLKSRGLPDCLVEVAKTSTVKSLIKHFMRSVGKAELIEAAFVEFEGDRVSPSDRIQDTEIENDDQVEIVVGK